MMCDEPKVQLYLYLDGELAPPEAAEVEQHLRTCTACEVEATAHHRLQSILQDTLAEEPGADRLWHAIEAKLPMEVDTPTIQNSQGFSRRMLWRGGAAAAALVVFALGARLWLSPTVADVAREIVDSQIRAQLMQAPYEKVPQDAKAVRRWFDGQVEFALPVPVMSSNAFNLVGVRLNYFLNRRVAEIAYASEEHIMSFLMFANKGISLNAMKPVRLGDRTFHVQTYKGYSTVLWRDGEIFCSVVSDLNLTELLQVAGRATGSLPAS